MKDYDDMSYFDINKAVAIALGIDLSGITQNNYQMYNMKDYCNSWADAGPIIKNNRIPIHPVASYWQAGFGMDKPLVADENPLRAAMIVFLMMQESK